VIPRQASPVLPQLTPQQRSALRARAHLLHPVVMIGDDGLTDPVLLEIGRNLDAHELIKIRVAGDDRAAREDMLRRICEDLGAAPVQHIGKILVVFRARPEKPAPKSRRPGKKAARPLKRSFQHRA